MIEPFRCMARGRNARHELYERPGHFTHPDGWGAVFEDGGRLVRVRSTRPCWEDPALGELAGRRVFLLHARRASRGDLRIENVHPFEHEAVGRGWFFCHNGTIRDPLPRPVWAEGETDSEAYFGKILESSGCRVTVESLGRVVRSLEDYTSLNAYLLSESEAFVVCAWRDLELYYTLHTTDTLDGPLFSSEPLAELGGGWRALPCGEIEGIDLSTGSVTSTRVALRKA